jgi:hypothetical protein
MKTLDDVKTAAAAGHKVYWKSEAYQVVQDSLGRSFVKSKAFEYWHPLTDSYRPEDFFLLPPTLPEDLLAETCGLFCIDDWKAEVAADETRLGWFDWLDARMKLEA